MASFGSMFRCALFLVLIASNSVANDLFYVSPDGNDNWSGRLPTPNAQGTNGPWRTPEGARAGVYSFKLANGNTFPQPVQVFFREGVYTLQGPWELNAPDSGVAGRPVTYRNYPGETPILSGGRVLSGWQQEGHLWTVQLPEVAAGQWWFSTLFVDGELRLPARSPNLVGDPRDTNGDGFFNITEAPEGQPETIGFAPGDVVPYTNPDDVYFFFPHAWEVTKHRIESIDFENNRVTFKDIRPGGLVDHPAFGLYDPTQRYAVYHAREALDRPGEWWLDRSNGKLYYFPFPEEVIGVTQVVAPKLDKLVYINAFGGNPVRHVHFEGLHFQHGNYALGPHGAASTLQGMDNVAAQKGIDGAFTAAGYRNGSIVGCTFAHMANFGILLQYDCDNVTIRQNRFHDLGAGAIDVGRDFLNTGAIVVENNWVQDCGKFVPSVPAIRIGDSPNNVVAHNHVAQHPYTGIWVGWVVGYAPSATSNNWIHHNHVHHIGGSLMSDMGGIYTLSIAPGTIIEHNLVHDVSAYEKGYGGWGIYLDEGSSQITVRNNLVYGTRDGGFHLHYGRDNLIENNIFAWSHEHQIQRTRIELFGNSFEFRNNIVYFNTDRYSAGAWGDLRYLFHSNLIYDASGYPFLFPQHLSFSEWQTLGQDLNSLLLDPLFLDPRQFDFTLNLLSPALSLLNFNVFNVDNAGLQGDPAWVAGPLNETYPPTPIPLAPEEIPYHYDFEATDLSPDWTVVASGNTFVAPSANDARVGAQSLHFRDSAVAGDSAEPAAYIEPRYRFGQATLRFWVKLSNNSRFAMEWRERKSGAVGPNFIVDGSNLRISGSSVATFPRNEWVQFEITTTLGLESTGRFNVRFYREGIGWQSFNNRLYQNSAFRRLDFLSFFDAASANADVYLDELELFTDQAIYPEPVNAPPYISGAQVTGPNTVALHFTEDLNPGGGAMGAANPLNYAVSGFGRGTLPLHPTAALVNGNTVQLQWAEGKMYQGGPLAITVAATVRSTAGIPMTPYRVALTSNHGQAVLARPVVSSNHPSLTNANPLGFTVNFGEPVSGLTGSSLSLSGATLASVSPTGTAESFTVWVNPNNPISGTASLQVNANNCTDLAGNPCLPSLNQAVVAYDYVAPAPVLSSPEPPLSNSNPLRFVVDFGEIVTGFNASKLTLSNGAVNAILPQGESDTYTIDVTPAFNGAVSLKINGAGIVDLAGNTSQDSNEVTRQFDGNPPTPMTFAPSEAGPVNTSTAVWTLVFDKPVSGLSAGAFQVLGATALLAEPVQTGNGASYTLTLNEIAGDGPVSLRLNPSPGLTDTAGNGLAQSYTSDPIIIDTTPPVLFIAPLAPKVFNCGEETVAPLVIATDNIDGDVSSFVLVSGDLPGPFAAPGEYPVTYTVSDRAGNESEVVWIIEIEDNCPLLVEAEETLVEKPAGEIHQFRVLVSGNLGQPSYQWYRVSENKGLNLIPGAHGSNLYLGQLSPYDAGDYLCVVSDAVTSRNSPVMTLLVLGQLPLASFWSMALMALLLAGAGFGLLHRPRMKPDA